MVLPRETLNAMRYIAIALLASGCSVATMKRPKDYYPQGEPPRCTYERGPAHLDVGVAVLAGGGGALGSIVDTPLWAAVAAPVVITYAISAMMGYGWAGECRDAIDAYYGESARPGG